MTVNSLHFSSSISHDEAAVESAPFCDRPSLPLMIDGLVERVLLAVQPAASANSCCCDRAAVADACASSNGRGRGNIRRAWQKQRAQSPPGVPVCQSKSSSIGRLSFSLSPLLSCQTAFSSAFATASLPATVGSTHQSPALGPSESPRSRCC